MVKENLSMATLKKYWKEEPAPVNCPRCGAQLVQQFPCDEEATAARPVPGLLYSSKADCIYCRKCSFRMVLGKKKPPSTRLSAYKFKPEHT